MSDLRIYDRAAVRVNGRYIVQSTSVRLGYQAADEVVPLLGGGTKRTFCLAPDSRLLTVQWDMVVPTDDAEDLKLIRSFLDCDVVKLGVDLFGSRRSLTSEGFLQSPSLTGSVGASLSYTIGFIGEPVELA